MNNNMHNLIQQFFRANQSSQNSKPKLSKVYDLQLQDTTKIPASNFESHRMNYIQISQSQGLVFIAEKRNIGVYPIHQNGQIDLKIPNKNLNKNQRLKFLEIDAKINNIKVASFYSKAQQQIIEYLVAVDMKGQVTVFNTENLNRKKILDNCYQDIQDNSTWSLDIFLSDEKQYIVVGSNSRYVSMWEIQNLFDTYQSETPERIVIGKMEHNVPCVKFSPCGQYIAATTIGQRLCIFDLNDNKRRISNIRLPNWGWGIAWVDKQYITNYQIYKEEWESHLEQIDIQPPHISKYLIVNTMEKEINLVDPAINKVIQKADFKLTQAYLYAQISRYTLLEYIPSLNLLILPPQHAPYLTLAEIIYDKDLKEFKIQQINTKLTSLESKENLIIGNANIVQNNPCNGLNQEAKLYIYYAQHMDKIVDTYRISKQNQQIYIDQGKEDENNDEEILRSQQDNYNNYNILKNLLNPESISV